ncbi:hypothetical protein E3N88_14390 [Mikania micrantha]|uniref:Uncharacterized protein n=1 Tax=Mikania micrantha TaxID=192012 RepID=A0A5N6P196_9ASTR|nr:hypothetical protein E3N88_14390 [Mikania micrantha]
MSICRETMLVIEKYAKNGPKHENGPNWAWPRVQAVRLTQLLDLGVAREVGKCLGCRLTRATWSLGRSRKTCEIFSPPSPLLALIKERFQELERLLIHYLNTFEALEGRS